MERLQNVWLQAKTRKDEEVNLARQAASSSKNQVMLREEKQMNRSIYTKHLFDIVGNITKQQDEINKIAEENLLLQKEIKSVAGKLQRSFTVVEGRLYNVIHFSTL
ncbi:unnamed protein product [Gongylonema pulchrum]|uniref:Coiled-coil domain-containing protein 22 homolog n=1 Tax=Gongylonema pulchrum TaxID=637853 RepID=A0A183ER67_9BILA|nr:unnamed protein product [Gongylonema pulchrum]